MPDDLTVPTAALSLSLRIDSSLSLAAAAMAAVGRLMVEIVGAGRGEHFAMACAEAVNMAIRHAGPGDERQVIGIGLTVGDRSVTASIADQGSGVLLAERLAALPVNPYEDDGEPAGSSAGLWLMRQGADSVDYRRGPTGNELVLTLNLGGA